MRSFSFRIRKRYFDDVVAGKKTVEYRRDSPFWRVRVANLTGVPYLFLRIPSSRPVDAIGVFICGKRIHRRKITKVEIILTPDDFSNQGKKDVDTKLCFAFYLGDAIQ